jgi:undecaprenyl-diphosphatase
LASPTLKRTWLGVAIGVVALLTLGTVTEDVVNHDPLTQFDTTLLESLHRHSTSGGLALFGAISRLGSPLAMTVLALAGVFVLAVRRQWIVLGGWVAAFSGAGLIDEWLKLAIHRPRPAYAATLLHQTSSWSFPSGHAMGSLVGYGMLAYVLLILGVGRGDRSKQALIVTGAALLIVAIGVSRLYLGVHYFSDVVGGYAAGLLWLSTCVCTVELARRWQRLRVLRLNPTS